MYNEAFKDGSASKINTITQSDDIAASRYHNLFDSVTDWDIAQS